VTEYKQKTKIQQFNQKLRAKLVVRAHTSPFSEMMRSCICFSRL